jgi:uncharacterized protein (DUF1501 family)
MACCDDFTRSQLLRNAAAEAGRGLPAIEPGMPEPAGTGLSRRSFLIRSAGMALAVYGAGRVGAFEEGVAAAAGGSGRVLVSIFLPGGCDGMSVLAPVGDPQYAALRPNLALPASAGTAFSEDDRLRWSPSAAGLAALHGEGKVSVLPAIGYDHPDQSHFTSRHFWEVGALDAGARYGWLGRYLDAAGTADNPLQGLSLDGDLSPALAPARVPVAAVRNPEDFDFWIPGVGDPLQDPTLTAFGELGRLPTTDPARISARKAAREVDYVRRQLVPFAGMSAENFYGSKASYPDSDFARRLAGLGAMLAGGLPLKCVTISADGGFDTHSDQAGTLDRDVKEVADAVFAFQRDLEARGLANRVLTTLWSEFGRRPEENGSGTDHGAAGAAFVIGTKARGQMVGEFPGLATLDEDDNLRATSDFRAMYCSLLEDWMGFDAERVIPGAAGFARPALVKP